MPAEIFNTRFTSISYTVIGVNNSSRNIVVSWRSNYTSGRVRVSRGGSSPSSWQTGNAVASGSYTYGTSITGDNQQASIRLEWDSGDGSSSIHFDSTILLGARSDSTTSPTVVIDSLGNNNTIQFGVDNSASTTWTDILWRWVQFGVFTDSSTTNSVSYAENKEILLGLRHEINTHHRYEFWYLNSDTDTNSLSSVIVFATPDYPEIGSRTFADLVSCQTGRSSLTMRVEPLGNGFSSASGIGGKENHYANFRLSSSDSWLSSTSGTYNVTSGVSAGSSYSPQVHLVNQDSGVTGHSIAVPVTLPADTITLKSPTFTINEIASNYIVLSLNNSAAFLPSGYDTLRYRIQGLSTSWSTSWSRQSTITSLNVRSLTANTTYMLQFGFARSGFTDGAVTTLFFKTQPATLSISANPTTVAPDGTSTLTFTFSSAVTGFTADDIDLSFTAD